MLHTVIISLACASKARLLAGPDVAAEVHRESKGVVQIHDVFQNLEKDDVKNEKVVKGATHMVALVQTQSVTSPKDALSVKVQAEKHQNIQIHDAFASWEKEDKEVEKRVRANAQLHAFMQGGKPRSDVIANEVKEEGQQNLQIHDTFKSLEKDDKKREKNIHVDRDLSEIQQKQVDFKYSDDADAMDKYLGISNFHLPAEAPVEEEHKRGRPEVEHTRPAASYGGGGIVTSVPLSSQLQKSQSLLQTSTSLRAKTAPGVEKSVAAETMEDVYLADEFRSLEKKDKKTEKTVRSNPYMKA